MNIRLKDLTFRYSKDDTLKGINLEIRKGSFTAILGKNGSGKTTLAKSITGLLIPTHGEILLGDENSLNLSVKELSSRVSYLFQNPDDQIFSKTVYDEVAFGPLNIGFPEDRISFLVRESLKITGLEDLESENPLGLNSEKRRLLALSSVLAMDSRIIIMDEPSCGLGSHGREILKKVLLKIKKEGKTLLMITHDMNFVAENLSNSVLIKEGKILFHGKTGKLFSQNGICREGGLEIPQMVKLGRELNIQNVQTVDGLIEAIDLKRKENEKR